MLLRSRTEIYENRDPRQDGQLPRRRLKRSSQHHFSSSAFFSFLFFLVGQKENEAGMKKKKKISGTGKRVTRRSVSHSSVKSRVHGLLNSRTLKICFPLSRIKIDVHG